MRSLRDGRAAPASAAAPPPKADPLPPDRTEPFESGEYLVVLRGAYDVVRRDYYSPVPDLAALPEGIWERRSSLDGIDLRVDAALELVEGPLRPFFDEFPFTDDAPPPRPGVFGRRNDNYEDGDAETLYALVRHLRPSTVLELTSGFTTLLIGEACRRNAADDAPTRHVAFDPYPRPHILGDEVPPPTVFEPTSALDVPLETFEALEAGDVLFVDTTHTVKVGSDVNFLILDVLPRLRPGVVVHFHDIFLPYEYPRRWFEQDGYFWAEQYLLQAFLTFNDAFEVLLPAHALAIDHADSFAAAIPTFRPGATPGAFWLRRR